MEFLDILYTSLTTIGIIILIQLLTYFTSKLIHPPEPRIIYRDREVREVPSKVAFTEQPIQEVKLPEYEPRQQVSTSLRMDPELPLGIQETRPPGT
jgi:hypothetical protein